MKVLFVYATIANSGLSVKAQKIEDGFRGAGHDVTAIYFSSAQGRLVRAYEWVKVNCAFLASIMTERYDVIYIRYAYYFGLMYLAAWLMRCPFQVEVNSNAQGELAQLGQGLRAKCDQLAIWIACHGAKRIHIVSRELTQVYQRLYPTAKVVFNPNFVVSEECPSDRVLGQGSIVNLVFLGNAGQPWHGIEKFIQKIIIDNRWFASHCCLHIVGESTAQIAALIKKHGLREVIQTHGFLTGTAKADVLAAMDIGIGCFDLAVKGMQETTSIKNGEYLHSGLALLLGYEDYACPSELPFVGKIILDDQDVWPKFEAYIEQVKALPDLRMKAHEYARAHLLVKHYIDKITAR